MLIRRPLNGLQPRTEREAARDPYDWWDASTIPMRVSRAERIAGVVLAIVIGASFGWILVKWFTE